MVQVETERWYAVYAKPRKEDSVIFHARRKGVEIFFPKLLLPHTQAKRQKLVPLFPSYLFIRIDIPEQYDYVRWSPGVRYVVNFNGTPAPLDDSIISFLKQQADADGILAARSTLEAGQEVLINDGPFTGLVGILQNPPDARERVKVLLELLGRHVKVEVPVAFTESPSTDSPWTIADADQPNRLAS